MGKEGKIKAVEAKLSNLPDEMELDILLRLPVKSLLRFKAVCKPWATLINDPNFVKTNLHPTNQGNNINLWRLCYAVKLPPPPGDVCVYSRGIEASDIYIFYPKKIELKVSKSSKEFQLGWHSKNSPSFCPQLQMSLMKEKEIKEKL